MLSSLRYLHPRPASSVEMMSTGEFEQTFRREALSGLRLSMQGRVFSMSVIAVLLWFIVPYPTVLFYDMMLACFVLLGVAHYALRSSRYGHAWQSYVFVALDFALLTVTTFLPMPFAMEALPAQHVWRHGPIVYYCLLLVSVAFYYSPTLMFWAGCAGSLGLSAGMLWLFLLPDTVTRFDHAAQHTPTQYLQLHLSPYFVDIDLWLQNVVLLLLIANSLAAIVWRSRRLVIRRAIAARERANLARYFSPKILEEVQETNGPLLHVRKHEVAILFADIVGFTALCEKMSPEDVMAFLREYHTRMEEQVFRFGGTLDKFIGDAVMASFGAPHPGSQDATDALHCARAMLDSIAAWNRERYRGETGTIRIGIGLHYGLAVMGDVGSERCASFAVIGDTTNTTSRLQALTRTLDVDLIASQALLDAVRREALLIESELAAFKDRGFQSIRGRERPLHIWALTMPCL